MVQPSGDISQTRVQRKGSSAKAKRRAAPAKVRHICGWCQLPYKGSAQSAYCCKSHMEAASRARKEALIEALAQFLHNYSERLTTDLWGRAVQMTWAQALRKATECVDLNYIAFKYRMLALGYIYSERDRAWQRPRLLEAANNA